MFAEHSIRKHNDTEIYILRLFFSFFLSFSFFYFCFKKHKKFIVGIYQFFIHSLSFEIDLSSYRFLNLVETFTYELLVSPVYLLPDLQWIRWTKLQP